MTPVGRRCGAAAIGLLLDRALGEPPDAVHPVAAFGTVMGRAEGALWRNRRDVGVLYTALGVAVGAATGRLARSVSLAVLATVAGHQLRTAAARVGDRLDADDLDGARKALPWLVGRDPSELDASAVSAAVVESLAENSVDAIVAPVWWAVIAGAPGAAAYRAINTMDAMVGHRTARLERFGWASARLDDVANWLPARAYVGLVVLVEPRAAGRVVALIRRDAGAHPSPNAGVAETAMAAALGRTLGGTLRYGDRVEHRPELGDGPRPDPSDIRRAIDRTDRLEWLLTALLSSVWLLDLTRSTRDH